MDTDNREFMDGLQDDHSDSSVNGSEEQINIINAGSEETGEETDNTDKSFDEINIIPQVSAGARDNGYSYTPQYEMNVSAQEEDEEVEDETQEKKKGHFFRKLAAVACLAAVCGCCGGLGFSLVHNYLTDKQPESEKKEETAANYSIPATVVSSNSSIVVSDVADVVDVVMPSVVSISCKTKMNYSTWPGYYTVQEVPSSGSGIIIGENDDELLIVTNNHVVEDATEVSVSFIDDEVCEATVKGTDASVDIAVVSVDKDKIKKETAEKIKLAAIGDSDKLRVGETAIAIGNAMGYGQSVTLGCVSALNREVTIENVTYTAIQTDAAINPGNSGGALVNAKGELIGINSAKLASTQVEGIGYAIPISKVMPIIEALMKKEFVPESEKGYLGITGKTVTEQIRQMYDAPYGVIISVVEGTPVDKAGLVDYDIITKIDGIEMKTIEELIDYIGSKKKGDEVEITYERIVRGRFEEDTVKVVLDKRPADFDE